MKVKAEVWFHIDVNSAFLSWEAAYRTIFLGERVDLRTIASVVGGSEDSRHGIVLAKSMLAKKYGIKTGESLAQARSKCPSLVIVPPNYNLYVRCSKALIKHLEQYTDDIHQYSIDEAFCNMTGSEWLLGNPVVVAEQLKNEIKEQLGFTVNIGIGTNKLLAKMASEMRKPDMVHTLFPEEIESKLWRLPVEELFYVGKATKRKLNNMGVKTIGELAKLDLKMVKQHLKSHGEVIWQYAHGIDESPFLRKLTDNKGYGNSMTTAFDVEDITVAKQVILSLVETVGSRIRLDGVKITCIGITFVTNEFEKRRKQKQLRRPTDVTLDLYEEASMLFSQIWKGEIIRQIGVHTTQVVKNELIQYNLFEAEKNDRFRKLDCAIDEIRAKYGEDIVKRASFIDNGIDHMNGGIDKEKRTGITKSL